MLISLFQVSSVISICVSLSRVLSKLYLDEWLQRIAGLSWGSEMSNKNSFLKAQAQAEWDAIKSTKKVLLGQLIKQYIEKVCQHKVCWYCKRKICFVNGFIQYIFKFMMHHNFDQIHDTPKTWQDIIHLRFKSLANLSK